MTVECPECPAEFETPKGVERHRVMSHGLTWRHGTESGYAGRPGRQPGCRCGACTEAHRRYRAAQSFPKGRPFFKGFAAYSVDRDIPAFCEDRDDPADPRRDDVAILHLGASKALCARSSGVMEAMIRGLSESR